MEGWSIGLESHTRKSIHKDSMSVESKLEEHDFTTGKKHTHNQEQKLTSSQEASLEKFQLGVFKGTEQKALIRSESEQGCLVAAVGTSTGPSLAYSSVDMNTTPVRENKNDGSDEELCFDEKIKQQNSGVLRKRTRRREETKETGMELKDSYKSFGLHF